jgi:hypothetical protein
LAKSEKLAFQACAELTNEVLAKHGHGDVKYDGTTLLHEFVGQNFRGMVNSLEKKLGFTVEPKELDNYVDQEVVVVTAKLREFATECPGAVAQVKALDGKIPMVRRFFSNSAIISVGSMSTLTGHPTQDIIQALDPTVISRLHQHMLLSFNHLSY